jgi:hypothetical protein
MEHRYSFTDMELEHVRTNYGWLAEYFKPLQGATVSKVFIGVTDDAAMDVFPVIEFSLTNGEKYLCDVVCANDPDSPGFIAGLPSDHINMNTPKL